MQRGFGYGFVFFKNRQRGIKRTRLAERFQAQCKCLGQTIVHAFNAFGFELMNLKRCEPSFRLTIAQLCAGKSQRERQPAEAFDNTLFQSKINFAQIALGPFFQQAHRFFTRHKRHVLHHCAQLRCNFGIARSEQETALTAHAKRFSMCLAPNIIHHEQTLASFEQFVEIVFELIERRRIFGNHTVEGINPLAQFLREIRLLAQRRPQNAVRKSFVHLRLIAQCARHHAFANAAHAVQSRGFGLRGSERQRVVAGE